MNIMMPLGYSIPRRTTHSLPYALGALSYTTLDYGYIVSVSAHPWRVIMRPQEDRRIRYEVYE